MRCKANRKRVMSWSFRQPACTRRDIWRCLTGKYGFLISNKCVAFTQATNIGRTDPRTKCIVTTEMKKFLLLVFATLVIVLGVMQPASAVGPSTPEAVVRSFYTWYIGKQDARNSQYFQLMDDTIYRYVSRNTVNTLRDDYRHNRLPGDTDYFTRVQDLDPKIWLKTLTVHPAIMLGGVAVIPVTFGVTSQDRQDLVVFVVKDAGHWRITKVEDTDGYLGYHQYDPKD
jgi:Protein of unknown function (DUF3828)